jgi:hypothetical protein
MKVYNKQGKFENKHTNGTSLGMGFVDGIFWVKKTTVLDGLFGK